MVVSAVPPFAAGNSPLRVPLGKEAERHFFGCGTGVHYLWNEFPSSYHRCYQPDEKRLARFNFKVNSYREHKTY